VPKPLSYFTTLQHKPDDWIIPRLLKRGNTGFINGEPKRAAKSWLLLNLGWDLTDSSPVWNVNHSTDGNIFTPERPMRVLYFTQEDTEDDFKDRHDLLVQQGGRVDNNNFLVEAKNLDISFDQGRGERIIEAAIADCAPLDLVMFDPMRRIHPYDENDSQQMARLWQSVSRLKARHNCAVIFAHHVTKPSATAGYERTSAHAARGSTDIFGGADLFITITQRKKAGNPKGSKDARLQLDFEVERSKPVTPIWLTVSFDTGLVTFDGFVP
jgi:AAA domain